MTQPDPTPCIGRTVRMPRLGRAAAVLPLCLLLSAPAIAAPLFNFEIRGTFNEVNIGGEAIGGEFVITGSTTSALSGMPGVDDPVTAPVDTSTLAVSYAGSSLAVSLYSGLWTYGLIGADEETNIPPIFQFNGSSDPFELRAQTELDSLAFETTFGGTTAWLGFGGASGQNMGLTISRLNDVVQFGEDERLAVLSANQVTRTATFVPGQAVPVSEPAIGWLILAALGGLVLQRRKAC